MTTQQPRHSEPSVNTELGNLLQGMLFGCKVWSENTQLIDGQPNLQLDNLITAPDRAPVVVEAEYETLGTGESDAKSRLGLPVVDQIHSIEASIALRYPDTVRFGESLRDSLNSARLTYAVFYDDEDQTRFPESGWLDGSVIDLADLIRLVSVPQKAVDAAADALEDGIDRAATILNHMAENRPSTSAAIARLLGMADVTQTRRMASAILANALVFHERIAGMHDGVNNLELVCGSDVANPKAATLSAWKTILDINYWSIFAIARDILSHLPASEASQVLNVLRHTAEEFGATGVTNAHDLTGRIFQRLIADRKYLATFYTLPASAALLARLAVAKMDGIDWSDPESIGNLRIGDFACGTGALLSAVYDQVAARHERAGGDPSAIHVRMMEQVLYGCDVMPSAIHITGSTLSGAHPHTLFAQSRLYTLAYGRQKDDSVKVGSLELLQSSAVQTLFNTSDPAHRTGSVGEQTAAQINAEIPDVGFDMVIMNPPFTSNTKNYDADDGVVNAAFAAYDATQEDQDAMASRLRVLSKNSTYHGHAGLASAFVSLADRKLKPGGIIALVLPFTAINGSSWSKFRELVATKYSDPVIVSIAAESDGELSFSADTGMAECLIIARKIPAAKRGYFTSLRRRPSGFAHAATIANSMVRDSAVRGIEDGPFGGTPLVVGAEIVGESLEAPIENYTSGWGMARIRDASVAQTAYSLSHGTLWLPAESEKHALPVSRLSDIGTRGIDHQFFVSAAHNAPFTKEKPSPTANYPALWNHHAQRETKLVCLPDAQMRARFGMETAAQRLWSVASRSHVTQEFRFTSQPLAVAITDQETIGGRAWPNVKFPDPRFDPVFALWGNSTLGLLLFWWQSSRQQSGRGALTINGIESLPTLDFRTLTDRQLSAAKDIFEEFRELELKPAYLADADANRAHLDHRVVCDLLDFDEQAYRAVRRLSAKWCAEPSVHGGKSRPESAQFVS